MTTKKMLPWVAVGASALAAAGFGFMWWRARQEVALMARVYEAISAGVPYDSMVAAIEAAPADVQQAVLRLAERSSVPT